METFSMARRTVLQGSLAAGAVATLQPRAAIAAPASAALDPSALEAELAGLNKPIYLLETVVPDNFAVAGGGGLSISDVHGKVGRHSLRWDHLSGSQMTITANLHVGTADAGDVDYFAVWLYNEQAVNDVMRIQFGNGTRSDAYKDVNLNFTGWRAVWLRYTLDLEGTAKPDMNTITLIAPGRTASLWIDQVVTNASLRSDRPTPDLQVEDVNEGVKDDPNFHWMGLLTYWRLMEQPGFDASNVTASEISDAQAIRERLLARQWRTRPITSAALTSLETMFAERGIPTLADPAATGDALKPSAPGSWVYDKQLEVLPAEYQDAIVEMADGQLLRALWDQLGLLTAQTWETARRAGNTTAAARAEQLVLRLTVHMLDQGWAGGSGQGTIHHIGYTFRSWVDSLLMLEPLLRQRGLWEKCSSAIEWYVGTGRLTYDFSEPRHRSGLIDVLNTLLNGMLSTCFVPDTWEERVGRLRAFHAWIDHAYTYTPGLDGGFKPDGSMYHHNGPYTLYGRDALSGSIPVVLDAVGTSFALGAAGQQVLKDGLRFQILNANSLEYPMSQSGRQQTSTQNIRSLVIPQGSLGRAPLDGTTGFDRDQASMFRRLLPPDPTSAMTALDQQFAAAGIEKAPAPNGYWSFNYSATALRRDGEWMAAVRGHNRHIWSSEIYVNNNLYGRYQTYGQITVLADTNADRWTSNSENGVVQPGYDWNFLPGATTKTLPFEVLEQDLTGTAESLKLSESAFGGAGVLDGHATVFGMELKEHPAYDRSHTARISVLMVGDRLIALGSAVSNSDGVHPTRTTLFQACPQVMVNPQTTASGRSWVTDPAGHGYVVLDGPRLVHRTDAQTTPDQTGLQQGTRVVSLGYLDHGTAPRNSGYAYVMLVQGGPQRTADLAAAVRDKRHTPVRILQRDKAAHVVTDTESGVTAHVIFEPGRHLHAQSLVHSASRQILVLTRPEDDEQSVRVSITDPDLHLYEGRDEEQYDGNVYIGDESPYTRPWQFNDSIPTRTSVELRGHWSLDGDAPESVSLRRTRKDTLVVVTSVDGVSAEFTLTARRR